MKYRLTRDDGVEIDVPGVLWESVLERAYLNGWHPSGTDAPWARDRRGERAPMRCVATLQPGGRWPNSDYFSARSQYVGAADARELGTAAMRGSPDRADRASRIDCRRDAGVRKVADFALDGGFVIGRAPDHERTP